MKTQFLISVALFAVCLSTAAGYSQLPWAELDHTSFESTIASEPNTLVLFYSENDTTTHFPIEILREAEHYAERLNVSISFAKINTDNNSHVVRQYKIDSSPTLVLFVNRKGIKYTKELTPEGLEQWLSNLLNRKLFVIQTKEDFEIFKGLDDKSKVMAIYPEEGMSAEKNILESLLTKGTFLGNEIFSVGVASNANLISQFFPNQHEVQIPSLHLIKSFESSDPIATFKGNLSISEEIREFISINNLPTLIEFEEDTISRLFQGYVNNHIYLFLPNKSETYNSLIDEFKKSAEHNYNHDLKYERIYHILFYANALHEDILMNFGLTDISKLPAVFITEIRGGSLNKYQFNTSEDITSENLKAFIEAFRMKNLTLFRLSEDIPLEESQGLVRKIVGKSFREEVILSPDSVQVMFCDDMLENPRCLLGQKIFNFVAKQLPAGDSSLRLGTIDSFRNEVERLRLTEELEIYLFKKGLKHKPMKFEFVLTVKSLVAWMNSVYPEAGLSLTEQEEEAFIKNELTEYEQKMIRSNMEILETMRINSQSKAEEPKEAPKMLGLANFRDL